MKKYSILFVLVLLFYYIHAEPQKVSSPDGKIRIEFTLGSFDPGENQHSISDAPYYRVFFQGKPFIHSSRLGFELAGVPIFDRFFEVVKTVANETRRSWKPVYGDKSEYPDNYNELTVTLQENIPPKRTLKLVFRAYNEGVAFRYIIPEQEAISSIVIPQELTEFAFAPNTSVWEEHGHEGLYHKVAVSDIEPNCELPLTVKTENGIYGAIAEAGNSHYPRAYVEARSGRHGEKLNVIHISLRGEAKGQGEYKTAWRSVTLSDRPGGLMEQHYLLLNLNEPCKLHDTSWIKPGTAMREISLTTVNSKKLIDYAEKMGIDYVILDGGWYGQPFDDRADPSKVNVLNAGPSHPGLNIQEVVSYGKEHDVGIWLYVNRQGLERYADKIFPLYESWGIKGIKPGFVNVGNQEWQEWMETIVEKAADHHLMVNIHDAYRPTGFSRTYPNLLTQEGIRGNEHLPTATHNATLPFTRFTIGAGDYTPGYCRSELKSRWAHKLAMGVIVYSPAQFLFWGEKLTPCHERPELEFWKGIPTTWDDTKVLSGEIGEYAVVARKHSTSWYVGGITNDEGRLLRFTLDFLSSGDKYIATVYFDGLQNEDQITIEKQEVDSKSILEFELPERGGFALKIDKR